MSQNSTPFNTDMRQPKRQLLVRSAEAKPINRTGYNKFLLVTAILALIYYTYAFFFLSPERNTGWLFGTGLAAGVVFFLLYVFHSRPYLFDPATLLGFNIFASIVLKVAYLTSHPDQMAFLLAGRSISMFIDGLMTMTWALALMLLCYFVVIQPATKFRNRHYTTRWSHGFVLAILLVTAFLSVLATLYIMSSIGFSSLLENFSAKRFNDLEGASGRLNTSLYIAFKVTLLARFGLCLAIVYLLTASDVRKKWLIKSLFVILLAITLVVSTMFSARAQAALALLDVGVLMLAAGYSLNTRYVLAAVAVVYAYLAYTALSRSGGTIERSGLDSIMGARYMLDFTKTAHILEYFRQHGGWLGGETFIGWLFIPIPESVFPNKPLFVDMGKWIGYNIFGYEISGVPPGFIGELYLNFGIPGIIVGMMFAGITMGLLWRWYVRRLNHPACLLFGSMIITRFAIILFNNDFGTFMVKIIIECLPVLALIAMCAKIRHASVATDDRRPFGNREFVAQGYPQQPRYAAPLEVSRQRYSGNFRR